MPLSEEELRLLEQMERALVEEDPKFASTLRGTTLRQSARRKAILAGVVFAGGIGVLMTGVIAEQPVVGIVGFLVMLVSATVGLTFLRGQRSVASTEGQSASGSTSRGGFTVIEGGRAGKQRRQRHHNGASFMDRMEERWRRRREDNGYCDDQRRVRTELAAWGRPGRASASASRPGERAANRPGQGAQPAWSTTPV